MNDPNVAELRDRFEGAHDLLRASDGATLFLRRWDAAHPSAVTVLLFHGITAYSGPYGPMLAEPLARAGISVVGLDLRGHGLSDGKRGDYPGLDRLVADLTETVGFVKARSQGLVVLGHSLGALCAIVAVQHGAADLRGLVLLSVGTRVRTAAYGRPSWTRRLNVLLGVTLRTGSPLIEYRRDGMMGVGDPLFNFRYSARFFATLYGIPVGRLARMLRSGVLDSPHLRFDRPIGIPLFVAVGDQDELFSVDAARELFARIEAEDRTFSVVPGARHAAFPAGSTDPLVRWLNERFRPS